MWKFILARLIRAIVADVIKITTDELAKRDNVQETKQNSKEN